MATIHDLLSIGDYASRAAPYLPSEASVRYFLRLHGKELRAAGAVVQIGRRDWIDPPLMDEMVVRLARKGAKAGGTTMN